MRGAAANMAACIWQKVRNQPAQLSSSSHTVGTLCYSHAVQAVRALCRVCPAGCGAAPGEPQRKERPERDGSEPTAATLHNCMVPPSPCFFPVLWLPAERKTLGVELPTPLQHPLQPCTITPAKCGAFCVFFLHPAGWWPLSRPLNVTIKQKNGNASQTFLQIKCSAASSAEPKSSKW